MKTMPTSGNDNSLPVQLDEYLQQVHAAAFFKKLADLGFQPLQAEASVEPLATGVGAEGKPLQSAGLYLSADDFVTEARAAGFIDTPELYDATVLLLKSMSRAAPTDSPLMPPAGTPIGATNKSQGLQVPDDAWPSA